MFGHRVAVKTVQLPGGGERAKAEYEDVRRVARETGTDDRGDSRGDREAAVRRQGSGTEVM